MKRVRGAIIDVDGTLVYSNDAHARAFVDAAEQLGIPAEYGPIRRMIGMGGDKLIPRAFGFEKESEQGQELDRVKGEIFRARYLPHLTPTPGARELLERLRVEGLTLVVATSANEEDLDSLLDAAGVRDLIDDATSSGEVEDSKPDPDVVVAALQRSGIPAEDSAMLGDTPYDVEAATRAGVPIVAVLSGGWTHADLAGAVAVYENPADVLANFDETVFAR